MSLKNHGQFLLVVLAALLTGCGPDYTPIGTGMIAIGVCLVLCAIVGALADLIKGEQAKVEPTPPKRPRKRANAKGKEEP
jgi:hypothetical protein